MPRLKNSSDGTKTTSFLGKVYNRIKFIIRWPIIWFVVFTKRVFGDAERWKSFNIKWESIDKMPIHNWIKILETGDLNWLFVTEGVVGERANDHWLNLQQQYIDEFGLDEAYKQQLRLMEKLKGLNLDFVLTRDASLLNVIRIVEIDLEEGGSKQAMSFYQILDHAEKYKGFQIDPKKTSVIKWYYSLKNMSNGKENTGK